MNKCKLLQIVAIVTILALVLIACQEKIVEKTVVVKETAAPLVQTVEVQVKETVVQEKVVTQEVEKVVIETVVQVVEVTATPVPMEVTYIFGDLPRHETFIVGSNPTGRNPKLTCFNYMSPATKCDESNGGLQLSEEPLFTLFNGKVIAMLGQKWEYNEDATEMRLWLTPGVTFSDGSPVTMEDWLFTFKAAQDNREKGLHVPFSPNITFEAVGEDVILFKFYKAANEDAGIEPLTVPEPNYTFHRSLISYGNMGYHPLPKKLWEGQDYVTYPNNPPVGTGPYKLRSCNEDTATCIWERREDYWNPALLPKPKYVVFTSYGPVDAAIEDFIAGNYDLGALTIPLHDRLVKENKDWAKFVGLDICPRKASFNVTVKPFDDVAFRHAMSLLINREAAAKLDTPPSYVMKVPWPYIGEPDTKWYDPADTEANDVAVYDPAKAAEILEAAGYVLDSNGKRLDKDGEPISFELYSLDFGAWGAWPRLFAYDAGVLGIDVVIKMPGDAAVFFDSVMKGNYGMSMTWACAPADWPLGDYAIFHTNAQKPIGEAAGWGSTGRYTNPRIDELVDQLNTMNPDDPACIPLMKELYKIYVTEKPIVDLFGAYTEAVSYGKYWLALPDGEYIYWGYPFVKMLWEASGIEPTYMP